MFCIKKEGLKHVGCFLQGLFLLVLSVYFSGCVAPEIIPSEPLHTYYKPINSAKAKQFVDDSLAEISSIYGTPYIPVQMVYLCQSIKRPESKQYRLRENFSMTTCEDRTNGLFTILIGVFLDKSNFYPLLGHECFHLLNSDVRDWYMEGMATVFSEEQCRELGYVWKEKKVMPRLRGGANQPYRLSYRMMRDLKQSLPTFYDRIPRYTKPLGDKHLLKVDIDGWLNSLPKEKRLEALPVISRYAKQLKRCTSEYPNFTVPSALMK